MVADHPTAAFIDLGVLVYNLHQLQNHLKGKSQVLAVVKANAYGHGILPVSLALEKAGVKNFGVAFVSEGIELRGGGIQGSILIMGGIMPQDVSSLVEHRLKPVIFHDDHLTWLSALGENKAEPIPVHIKVDTGMGRLGLSPEEVRSYIRRLNDIKGIHLEGVMTHFADEDLRNSRLADNQIDLFKGVLRILTEEGFLVPQIHMANTGALLSREDTWWNLVRPGLALYGYTPSRSLGSVLPIRPVMTLKSQVTHLRKVPAGTSISYGSTFVTQRESVIGVIPIGYADGYSRELSNRGEVLIKGRRAPILGRVCMDMMVVDLTGIPDVGLTEEVVLIGSQGKEAITAVELAERANTIPYEILSAIGSRIPRIYIEGEGLK